MTQLYAFLNITIHGVYFWDTVGTTLSAACCGTGHCHFKNERSGCGIMARCLPSLEQTAATPSADPFGLNGYRVVGKFSGSTYCITLLNSLGCSKTNCPSPWATHDPKMAPFIPFSMMELLSLIITVENLLSNLPD